MIYVNGKLNLQNNGKSYKQIYKDCLKTYNKCDEIIFVGSGDKGHWEIKKQIWFLWQYYPRNYKRLFVL